MNLCNFEILVIVLGVMIFITVILLLYTRDITWGDISNYDEKEKYLDNWITNLRTQVLSLKYDDILIIYANCSGTNAYSFSDFAKIRDVIKNINPDLVNRVLIIPIKSVDGKQNMELSKMDIDNLIQCLTKLKSKLE